MFSSHNEKADQDMRDGPGDILDKTYGQPKGRKTASTIREIIKESKNDLAMSLLKIGSKSR